MGMGVRHVLEAVGEGWRFKSLRVRLSKPVFPGEEIRTEMWVDPENLDGGRRRRVVYRMCVGERVVMKDAAVEMERVEGGDGGLGRGVGSAKL